MLCAEGALERQPRCARVLVRVTQPYPDALVSEPRRNVDSSTVACAVSQLSYWRTRRSRAALVRSAEPGQSKSGEASPCFEVRCFCAALFRSAGLDLSANAAMHHRTPRPSAETATAASHRKPCLRSTQKGGATTRVIAAGYDQTGRRFTVPLAVR